jgi:amidophosphoribosyltransferase
MGINIPTKEELIANVMSPDELAKFLGADSLVYLSVDGLQSAVRKGIQMTTSKPAGHCTACLTGKYPVELEW